MNFQAIPGDAWFLAEAVLISGILAALTWRHLGFRAASLVILGLAVFFAAVNALTFATPTLPRQLLVASFVIVPSVLLLGASRLRWLSARPWALLVAGPLAFVGCYTGLCYCAFRFAEPYFA
jgi:hypothetical protein